MYNIKIYQTVILFSIITLRKSYISCLLIFGLLFFKYQGFSQTTYLPYSYQFYQKLNKEVYSATESFHTSLKPFILIDSSTLKNRYDSLMTPHLIDTTKGIIYQLWFNRHLLREENKEYTIYFDILPDIQQGHQLNPSVKTSQNTRGVQMGGTVGKNFFFYSSLYENQARFADYINNHITTARMVPGQAYDRTLPKSDWAYVTTLIGYTINKNVNVVMGEDKTFIGDGYRSVLLSDYAAPYPLLRLNVNLKRNIQYTAMWAYLEDQKAKQFNPFGNFRRKWGTFHYVDWNINNKASLGFFNAIITEEADDKGAGHGFDLNYINPVYFTSSLQPSKTNAVPDHTLLGLNAKYNLCKRTTFYGQLLIDQTSQVSFGKRNAIQFGVRGSDLFTLKRLNYLLEFNTAKPYTYANENSIVNYTHFSEPLGHAFGANFKEYVVLLNYSIGRFDFQLQGDYATYGLNTTKNYGKDLLLSSSKSLPTGDINTTGQGLATTLKYAEGVIGFIINPKYNLRLEASALLREEKNATMENKTTLFSFGFKGSFRNLYHDY